MTTLHTPSGCFTMSIFGPLQKFSRTFVASGAFSRTSTRPLAVDARILRVPDVGGGGLKVRRVLRRTTRPRGRAAARAPVQVFSSLAPRGNPDPTRAPTCHTSSVDPFRVGLVTESFWHHAAPTSGIGNCTEIVGPFMPGAAEVVNVAPTSALRPAGRLCVTAPGYRAGLGQARFFNGLDGERCDAWMLE